MNWKKNVNIIGLSICVVVILSMMYFLFFAKNQLQEESVFVVGKNQTELEVVDKLKKQELIKSKTLFTVALYLRGKHHAIAPGGYTMQKNMTMWRVINKLTSSPDMKWIVVREGLRKEQIGELLADTFGWSEEEVEKWNTIYTKMEIDYLEGTYFPDTYLIPVDEDGLAVAKRMTRRFNEQFDPYIGQFATQNIKWTTGLTMASIIQREAGGKNDMPLIAGILWNRLQQDMNLEIDATVQYARGKTEEGWWAPITPEDITRIDSPYNTYMYKGLPPHPISNPGVDAIDAVLHPTETDCLYYLHDSNREIHCAVTYEEHKENIETYLHN
jgi:UPF0755 protein